MNPNDQVPFARFQSDLSNMIFWILLGLALLWFLGFAGQQAMKMIQPVVMFLIIALIVGIGVAHLIGF